MQHPVNQHLKVHGGPESGLLPQMHERVPQRLLDALLQDLGRPGLLFSNVAIFAFRGRLRRDFHMSNFQPQTQTVQIYRQYKVIQQLQTWVCL